MRLHFLSLAAVTATVLVAAVAPMAAQAETATTISGRVVDVDGEPIRGVSIWAIERGTGERNAFVRSTGDDGTFSRSDHGQLASGEWVLYVQDSAKRFVSKNVEVDLTAHTDNPLGDITLLAGGRVHGVVRTPSGAPVRNAQVVVWGPTGEAPDDDLVTFTYTETDTDGSYESEALSEGEHRAVAGFQLSGYEKKGPVFTIAPATGPRTADDSTSADISRVKVPVAISRSAKPSKGAVTLKVRISARKYGVAVEGGRFDVLDGTKRIAAGLLLTGERRTVRLTHLTKGVHTLSIRYRGSVDTQSGETSQVKVTVK